MIDDDDSMMLRFTKFKFAQRATNKLFCDFDALKINKDSLKSKALEWSITRGARSGRVAWQFILQLAGELNKQINLN